ncbi:hypothetical protein [Aquimarina sp. AU474]|uniref:hypothetical protein n=1 Tax=Aquimarina sp. AU474 TaxID=2108529 RepID=UPI000D6948A3|nr:hypothetical protein [Aquimarina sp. AU474]
MKPTNLSEIGLKQTIENLIEAGTSFDVEQLDRIYHEDLQVIMIDDQEQKTITDKKSFKELFSSKKENGDPPLNTWRKFNHIEVNNNLGHVIVMRRVNLTGQERKLILSIDLIWSENRWQVTREVILMPQEF